MTRSLSAATFLIGVFAFFAVSSPAAARELTIDQRVEHQRAIERVYWRHRTWPAENSTPKPPLSAVMPDAALRAKVEDYLRKSNALEKYWQRPVTTSQLQAEMDRMARDTRDGATLSELFHALGDDPYVIAETLARQTLVERLIRNWYANDTRFHGDVKAQAEEALASCRNVECMKSMKGLHQQTRSTLRPDAAIPDAQGAHDGTIALDRAEWSDQISKLATRFNATAGSLPTNRLSGLEETPDSFVVTAILAQRDNEITTATVVWPKRSFGSWWTTEAAGIGADLETTSGALSTPAVALTTCANDTWRPTSIEWLRPRGWHTAVWTGTEMIVWGGRTGPATANTLLNNGGRYNPSTDTWIATSTGPGVPEPRREHSAVWTGTEMIVWGGFGAFSGRYVNTGGRYNPSTDAWVATSTAASVPQGREHHGVVWTGTEMIVWGGVTFSGGTLVFNTGGRYNPSTDTWAATSTGANVPSARTDLAAVWTGTEMIVWGGFNYPNAFFNTGGRYNPSTDTWVAMSSGTGVPSARERHTAVWTGTEMIVWGGFDGTATLNTGGHYKPATDTWTASSLGGGNIPGEREFHTAVWTGSEMIVWGGRTYPSFGSSLNSGGRYNPSTGTWTWTGGGLTTPWRREAHTAVWTGAEMIVWGGYDSTSAQYPDSGARYKPSTDTWTPVATGGGVPAGRTDSTAVWTGAEMIVWGGVDRLGADLSNGGRYSPPTDTWTATSSGAPAPLGRSRHRAVWTGREMIVWGGYSSLGVGFPLNSGGRYSPFTDTWAATSLGAGVPAGRWKFTAVWTGTEMIVWGGTNGDLNFNWGGRYKPSSDTWTVTSITNAPDARYGHTAVWTGTTMIVWGGSNPVYLNSGGRYAPSTDTWSATSTAANVPSARSSHTAVWTGAEMIVWGGYNNTYLYTGGRYNPSSDTWTATSNVPSARIAHSAVWTGTEMIVWGGIGASHQNTGGRYNPSTDAWTATSTGVNVPSARQRHTAVWTGAEMIVWGGDTGTEYPATGGLYCACPNGSLGFRDADGDGYGDSGVSVATCDGILPAGYVADGSDCNDASGSVHPGAAETCNGVDDDCDGTIDDGDGSALCPDGNVCTNDFCNGISGCSHLNNAASCSDGDACTTGDACSAGTCVGSPGTVPGEVSAVSGSKSGELALFAWDTAVGASTYDLLRGAVRSWPVGSSPATETCLGGSISGTSAGDAAVPPAGEGFWYLVRAANGCGSGGYGAESDHGVPSTPRSSATCP